MMQGTFRWCPMIQRWGSFHQQVFDFLGNNPKDDKTCSTQAHLSFLKKKANREAKEIRLKLQHKSAVTLNRLKSSSARKHHGNRDLKRNFRTCICSPDNTNSIKSKWGWRMEKRQLISRNIFSVT